MDRAARSLGGEIHRCDTSHYVATVSRVESLSEPPPGGLVPLAETQCDTNDEFLRAKYGAFVCYVQLRPVSFSWCLLHERIR